jgi:hypothetical protein
VKLSTIEASLEAKWYLLDGEVVKEEDIGKDPAFLINRPTPKELRRMNKKAQKQLFTGRRKRKKEDVDILQMLLLHHCVTDWRNLERDKLDEDGNTIPVLDEDGKPVVDEEGKPTGETEVESLPCVKEQREYLDGMWKEFSEMWVTVATENDSIEDLMEEEETGNY